MTRKDYRDFRKLLHESSDEKRRCKLEKAQLDGIGLCLSVLEQEYVNRILINFDCFKTNRKGNKFYIKQDSTISERSVDNYNEFFDSKTFDAVVTITSVRTAERYTLFFVLKAVQNGGGYQDNAKKEIGDYIRLFKQNKNDNYHMIVLADGDHLDNSETLKKVGTSHKYTIATSRPDAENNISKILSNFINKII